LETLGVCHLTLLKLAVAEGVPRKLATKHRENAVAVFQRLLTSMSVRRGAEYPLTKSIEHKLAEAKVAKVA